MQSTKNSITDYNDCNCLFAWKLETLSQCAVYITFQLRDFPNVVIDGFGALNNCGFKKSLCAGV